MTDRCQDSILRCTSSALLSRPGSTGFSLSQEGLKQLSQEGCKQTQHAPKTQNVPKSQKIDMTGQSFKVSCARSVSAGAASIYTVLDSGSEA